MFDRQPLRTDFERSGGFVDMGVSITYVSP
jgi:hypothetical protein